MVIQERLQEYFPFSPEVIETVSEVAERQKTYSNYQQFFDAENIGEIHNWQPNGLKPVSILDIRPAEHDPNEALLLHLPMANPLDSNHVFQAATIAATNPNTRVIAIGNPSGRKFATGLLSDNNRKQLTERGNWHSLVDPLEQYAEKERIEYIDHAGYSYGALKAVISAGRSYRQVKNVVAIEPVVGDRSLLKLGADFLSTNKELKRYLDATELPIFLEAHKDGVGMLAYSRGLLRLTNIAIAHSLTHPKFDERVDDALEKKSRMNTTIVWGSESELALDGLTSAIVAKLQVKYGVTRVKAIRLAGQKHALANDVHLHAALILEGRKTD